MSDLFERNRSVPEAIPFSDLHAIGANRPGKASLSDTAFVATRFRSAMWRRPFAA